MPTVIFGLGTYPNSVPYPPPIQNVRIHNLATMGNGTPTGLSYAGIFFLNCAHIWIDHVMMTNSSSFGICVGGAGNIYTPWAASTVYAVGSIILPATNYGNNGWLYKCTAIENDDKSGGTSPTWPTVQGQTVQDNHVTWQAYQIPHAYDVHITDNKIIQSFWQPISVVNGLDLEISRNNILSRYPTNTTGMAYIDCEVNTGDDLMQYFRVCDNIIDMRYGISPAVQASDMTGISINGGGGAFSNNFGGGICSNNVIIGNDLGNSVSLLGVTGINLINLSHVICEGNIITGCYQGGIEADGYYITVNSNRMLNCGNFPGNRTIILSNLYNSMIIGNHIYTITADGAAPNITELTNCAGNFIDGNYLGFPGQTPTPFISTLGSASIGKNCINGTWRNGTTVVLPGIVRYFCHTVQH